MQHKELLDHTLSLVLFSSECFSHPNTSSSQHVRITEVLLYIQTVNSVTLPYRTCVSPSCLCEQIPADHALLLCPVDETVLTYVITELEVPQSEVTVRLPPSNNNYTITPLTPGTSYSVGVAYVNEVGQSANNIKGERLLVCVNVCVCVCVRSPPPPPPPPSYMVKCDAQNAASNSVCTWVAPVNYIIIYILGYSNWLTVP